MSVRIMTTYLLWRSNLSPSEEISFSSQKAEKCVHQLGRENFVSDINLINEKH